MNNNKKDLTKTLVQTLISIIVLIFLAYLSKVFLGDKLEYLSRVIVDKIGLWGIFFNVLFVDTFIVPLTPDIFLYILIMSKQQQVAGLILISIASVLGGLAGHYIGQHLKNRKWVQRLTANYRKKGENLFQRYGRWAVVLAALTPIPFSTVCWTAGIFNMSFKSFWPTTLFRIPRMILWYYIILLGVDFAVVIEEFKLLF